MRHYIQLSKMNHLHLFVCDEYNGTSTHSLRASVSSDSKSSYNLK